MAAQLRSILTAVKTAIATVNGSGGYTYDLSASGVVQIGEPAPGDGPGPPRVWVWLDSMISEQGIHLGDFRRVATINISAEIPVTSASRDAHLLASADVLDDMIEALEVDRSLGGLALDLIAAGMPLAGGELGLANMARAVISLEVTWNAISGAGV